MLLDHPRPTDLIVVGWGNFGNLYYVRNLPFGFAVDFACVQNTVVSRLLYNSRNQHVT